MANRWADLNSALRARGIDALVFALFLTMSAVLDARGIEHFEPDSHTYIQPAESLSAGAGFATRAADGALRPEFVRTPFYPLYLAAFLHVVGPDGLIASIWCQRVCWGLLIVAVYPGVGVMATRRGRLLCGFGKALCLLSPPSLVTASHVMSDVPFACLVTLGLFTAVRAAREGGRLGDAVAAGLLLGMATLTRPVGKLLPILIASLWWASLWWGGNRGDERLGARSRRTHIVVFLIAALVLPFGWSVRNWHLSGHFTLTPFFGANIALHRREAIEGMVREGATFGGPTEARYAQLVAEQDNALSALATLKAELGLDDFAGDALAGRVGMEALRRHPWMYARDAVYHMFNIVMAPADAQVVSRVLFRWERAAGTSLAEAVRGRVWSAVLFQGITRIGNLFVFLVLPMAVTIHAVRRGRLRLADGIYFGAACYFVVATSLVVTTYGRFLLPVLPSVAYALSRGHRSSVDHRRGWVPAKLSLGRHRCN